VKYDVVSTIGPSYATQRQESAQFLLSLVNAMPQQMSMAADLIVRNADFKDNEELENRLRKLLPPGTVKPKPGENLAPPPPNPAQIMAQTKLAVEQFKQQLMQMKVQQENIKLQHEKVKLQLELVKAQSELVNSGNANDNSAEKVKLMMELRERERHLDLEIRKLDLEEAKFSHQMSMDGMKHGLEYDKLDNQHEIASMANANRGQM
jgi:hypothetical protein